MRPREQQQLLRYSGLPNPSPSPEKAAAECFASERIASHRFGPVSDMKCPARMLGVDVMRRPTHFTSPNINRPPSAHVHAGLTLVSVHLSTIFLPLTRLSPKDTVYPPSLLYAVLILVLSTALPPSLPLTFASSRPWSSLRHVRRRTHSPRRLCSCRRRPGWPNPSTQRASSRPYRLNRRPSPSARRESNEQSKWTPVRTT